MKDIKEIVPPSEASPWYKDAIIYELHIRSFSDSDGHLGLFSAAFNLDRALNRHR